MAGVLGRAAVRRAAIPYAGGEILDLAQIARDVEGPRAAFGLAARGLAFLDMVADDDPKGWPPARVVLGMTALENGPEAGNEGIPGRRPPPRLDRGDDARSGPKQRLKVGPAPDVDDSLGADRARP